MDELLTLEKKIQKLYEETFFPLAERFRYELSLSRKDAAGVPSVLFLGNHSSGKSSFINHLVGREVQKTGLAPMDDGFTILTYGEKEDRMDGHTVITHPDFAYNNLEKLGPEFLSRLRLKTFPIEALKTLNFIDSPGMIDGASIDLKRGYNFSSSVRYFAEQADLVLFFFDPDKPGTTGETMSIFTETLAGLEHKLLIVLNKVDLFVSIRDFARTYGALCWNLSKIIRTKDMPHIFNLYLPELARGSHEEISLSDFDESREEVEAEIRRTPTRRTDNLVSDLYKNCRRLSVLVRVCQQVAGEFRRLRMRWWGIIGGVALITLLLVWAWNGVGTVKTQLIIGVTGGVMAAGLWFWSRLELRDFVSDCTENEHLEAAFARAYHKDLAVHDRADLRAIWDSVRKSVSDTLTLLEPKGISRSVSTWRLTRRLEAIVTEEIPTLRRDLGEHHRSKRKSG